MVRIIAWKCRTTGTLFEKKKLFLVHKARRAFERAMEAKKQARLQGYEDRVAVMRTLTSFAEIEDWLNSNGDALYDLALFKTSEWRRDQMEKSRKKQKKPTISEIELLNMQWSVVAATHSAPLGMKTSGWDGNKPERFCGWRGRLRYRQSNWSGFGSDVFKGTGIFTEGGGGGDVLEYDVILYAQDYPMMFQMMKQEGRLDPAIPYPLPTQPLPVPASA